MGFSLIMLCVAPAFAIEWRTPPLGNGGHVLGCLILNTGPTGVEVTSQLMDGGTVVATGTLTVQRARSNHISLD